VEVDETRKRLDAIGNLLRQRAQDRCARLSEESPLRYMESPAGRLDFRDVILNACLAESGELSSEEKQRHIRDTPSLLRKLQAERN
jgi:hypothetical protein